MLLHYVRTQTMVWRGNIKNNVFAPNIYNLRICSANKHFKRNYSEYKRMSLSEATQKVFDFLSEYDSLYRPEGATLSVSEQLMVDAEEFLDQFEDRFLDKDVTSSKNKQRCILDPFRSVNRGFTARVTAVPTCFTEKHSVLEFAEIASKFFLKDKSRFRTKNM